jgi:hypothetical protein
LSDETVRGITESGFRNIFPAKTQSGSNIFPAQTQSGCDIKSDTVEISKVDHKKIARMKSSDVDYRSEEESEHSDDCDDNENDDDIDYYETDTGMDVQEKIIENKTLPNKNNQTRNRRGSSKMNKLVSEKKERIYKNTKRRVKCPLCDLELATKSILKRHCLRRHPDEWFEFKCADCPCMFKTRKLPWCSSYSFYYQY